MAKLAPNELKLQLVQKVAKVHIEEMSKGSNVFIIRREQVVKSDKDAVDFEQEVRKALIELNGRSNILSFGILFSSVYVKFKL